jgi:hypothetical protein
MKPAMSPPEVKCLPSERTTTARTLLSRSISAKRSAILARISIVTIVYPPWDRVR